MKSDLVIFGGGGDLALRMLFPSLYFLEADGLLPDGLRVFACARQAEDQDAFLARVRAGLARVAPQPDAAAWSRLSARLSYVALDATDPAHMARLAEALAEGGEARRTIHYLATSPSLFGAICSALKETGLNGPDARVVLEKPLGRSLATFREVDAAVAAAFPEERVLRIDHYLGKETVQNLIALRFANAMFEPLWNSLSIDHVQITIAETEGVGARWPYYDEYGALRDMVQNHLLQLLCLVAMEPPSDLDPDSVRNEKVKVLRSLRPIGPDEAARCTVRGQYGPGLIGGQAVPGYLEERGAASATETFVAIRAEIDNWRWAGTPFFLRTGKRMPERRTEIVIQFKPVPHSIFGSGQPDMTANRLVIELQPQEDISLLLMNKTPGLERDGMRLQALPLSLSAGAAGAGPPARRRIAYERLLLDAIDGNSTLFVRRDEAEKAWEWIDGVAGAWERARLEPKPYAAGTPGPAGSFALMERSGRTWHE